MHGLGCAACCVLLLCCRTCTCSVTSLWRAHRLPQHDARRRIAGREGEAPQRQRRGQQQVDLLLSCECPEFDHQRHPCTNSCAQHASMRPSWALVCSNRPKGATVIRRPVVVSVSAYCGWLDMCIMAGGRVTFQGGPPNAVHAAKPLPCVRAVALRAQRGAGNGGPDVRR